MTERRIVLLRHAKAERPDGRADVDRPLTARGHADAAAAGAWLDHSGYLPAAVLCSPAKRTRQTWHDVALGMVERLTGQGRPEQSATARAIEPPAVPGLGPVVHYDERISIGGPSELLEVVRAVDAECPTVLLIGHNPGVSELSTLLDPVHADPDGLRTCGIAVHLLSGGWADLREDTARLEKWHTARG